MAVYLDLVVLLNFLVDLLLLVGTNRLCGYGAGMRRVIPSALLGGLYSGICMVPQMLFLGNLIWRMAFLGVMSVMAFGWDSSACRRGAVFVLLSMALGGIAMGIDNGTISEIVMAGIGICVLCAVGFGGGLGKKLFVTVELRKNKRSATLIALRDTGNTLRDPISGEQVLIVGADIAWELLELTRTQLMDPVRTMEECALHGLRLIPYESVGQSGGLLLAVSMDEVIINGKKSGNLVAFSPNVIGKGKSYQALTGGSL